MRRARHGGQVGQHALDDRRVRQHGAEEARRVGVLDQDRGEILDVEVVEAICMRLDVDPDEASIGVCIGKLVEG